MSEKIDFDDAEDKTILDVDKQENDQENKQEVENITLQLGDVIVIQSPGDYILDKKIFYIDYIDKKKIKIINVDDFSTNNLLINEDGTIADDNIKSIS